MLVVSSELLARPSMIDEITRRTAQAKSEYSQNRGPREVVWGRKGMLYC